MNKNFRGLIAVVATALFVYVAYKKISKPDSRKVLIKYLDATYGFDKAHEDFINKADKGYVDAWSKALMKGESTFTYNNKTYNTAGGTVKN